MANGDMESLGTQIADLVTALESLTTDNCALSNKVAQLGNRREKEARRYEEEIQALRSEIEQLKDSKEEVNRRYGELSEKNKTLEAKLSQLESRFCMAVPPFYFILENFTHYRKHGLKWYSPPFYSHHGGYKMSIGVDANGGSVGLGTHVSVYVYLLKGEYDEELVWPFCASVTVELLNERRDGGHYEVTIEFDEETPLVNAGRVIREERSAGWGSPLFVSHSNLKYNAATDAEYLKYDRLRFAVAKVELRSSTPA